MLFISGTAITNLLGDQVTPFFVWAMFSKKETHKDFHKVVRIDVNGRQLKYSRQRLDANRHILRSTASRYAEMIDNANEDPTRTFFKEKLGLHYKTVKTPLERITNTPEQYAEFEEWFFRYLQSSTKEEISTLRVSIETYQFVDNAKLQFIRSEELFSR